MQDRKNKRGFNWGSVIGWIIFILIFAGGPLLSAARRLIGSSTTLPANLTSLIPAAVAVLVVLSIVISAVRAIGGTSRGRGETRLPTGEPPVQRPSAPLPPFGGPNASPFGGPSAPREQPPSPRSFTLPTAGREKLPPPPRFEPILNPGLVLFGAIGIVALVVLGMLALGLTRP